MPEIVSQIERFQSYATDSNVNGVQVMNLRNFKDMIGILGSFDLSERMYSVIDRDHDGFIVLE
jgi:hypothetical protein